jgi:hypothetical protein
VITIVLFLWQDAQTQWRAEYVYDASFVLRTIKQLDQCITLPHEYVVVTDYVNFDIAYSGVLRVLPIERKLYKSGARYQKLMLFRPDAAELFQGDKLFYTDLDNFYFGNIDDLLTFDTDITLWRNPSNVKNTAYNTSFIFLRAGMRPAVYNSFNIMASPEIVKREMLSGTDQAWVSRVLKNDTTVRVLDKRDGIYSFREDYQKKKVQHYDDARVISFHGRVYPGSKTVADNFPQLHAAYSASL